MQLENTVNKYKNIARKLKVMGHPTRLQILDILRQGEVCVCHIERALNKRQAYVSQHLMILRDEELVKCRREGLQVYYRLADVQIKELLNLFFGVLSDKDVELLDDCSCPKCSTVLMKT